MNILIIGNGAREHMVDWKIKQSKNKKNIFIIPSNPGIEEKNILICIDTDITTFEEIYKITLKSN